MADTYRVLDQVDTVSMMPGARFEDVVEITIQTVPTGIVKRVTIPKNRYGDLDFVRTTLEREAAVAEGVHGL